MILYFYKADHVFNHVNLTYIHLEDCVLVVNLHAKHVLVLQRLVLAALLVLLINSCIIINVLVHALVSIFKMGEYAVYVFSLVRGVLPQAYAYLVNQDHYIQTHVCNNAHKDIIHRYQYAMYVSVLV